MKWTCLLLAGLVAVSLSACADVQNRPKQSAGTLVGAGLGALAGSQIGSGSGQLAAAQATQSALEFTPSGAATAWRNPDTGHAGSVTPVRTYESGGRNCRDFDQTLMVDGRAETVRGTACRQPDGTWRVQG